MRRWIAFLVLVGSAGLPPAARADDIEISQELFDGAGNPTLVANARPRGDGTNAAQWRTCLPQQPCGDPVAAGAFFASPDVPPGTTFQVATSDSSGHVSADASSVWQGRVTSVAAPGLSYERLQVGQLIAPVAGQWSGGWGPEQDALGLQFCLDPAGRSCEESCDAQEIACPAAGQPVALRYLGWYVQAVSTRFEPNQPRPAIPPRSPPYPRQAGSQVQAIGALVGPIAAAPAQAPAVVAPRILLRRQARRGAALLELGTVSCPGGCRVRIAVTDRRRTLRRTVSVPAGTARPVGLPARVRLVGGSARVRVTVGSLTRTASVRVPRRS